MSKSIKVISMVGFLSAFSACSTVQEEEFVVVEPIPGDPGAKGKIKQN